MVAQARARSERVGEVEVGRVLVATDHGGDPALGPHGGGLGELPLGQDADTQARDLRQAHDRRKPRDPAAQDEHVEIEAF